MLALCSSLIFSYEWQSLFFLSFSFSCLTLSPSSPSFSPFLSMVAKAGWRLANTEGWEEVAVTLQRTELSGVAAVRGAGPPSGCSSP